jgi:hypothetical protein
MIYCGLVGKLELYDVTEWGWDSWGRSTKVTLGTRVTPPPRTDPGERELPHRAPKLSGGAIEAFF